jgi:hypothetical protein
MTEHERAISRWKGEGAGRAGVVRARVIVAMDDASSLIDVMTTRSSPPRVEKAFAIPRACARAC